MRHRRLSVLLPALALLVLLVSSGAAATDPPRPQAAGDLARLTDGASAPELDGADDVARAHVEGDVLAALGEEEQVAVIVRLREQVDVPSLRLDDAATATALALERGAPGVYNVVDDEPAPVREWLPALAEAIGAEPPRRVPRWLRRLAAGEPGVVLMTEIRGASNAKAKRELGGTLRHPSWRQGFVEAYG